MNKSLELISYATVLGGYMVKNHSILIVGGDRQGDMTLISILQDEYDVVSTLNGFEALKIVKELNPDLILCNIDIPDVDKCELISELKGLSGDYRIPVIAVVDHTDMKDIKNLVDCADDLIMDPINPDVVKVRISNYLELKQLRDVHRSIVMIDPLIGIPNKDYLGIIMELEWRRAMRHQSPQSLIIVDIDYFKEYNESNGHTDGDRCLRKIAATIADCVKRDTDCVTRVEPTGFACLLAETDMIGAVQVAKTIFEAVEELNLPHMSSPIADHVTISMGVATMRPTSSVSSDNLVFQAEELLAEAKQNGCNQIKSR